MGDLPNRPWITSPLKIEGEGVLLESIAENHLEPLWGAAQDPEIWRWIPEPITSFERLRIMYERANQLRAQGLTFPFVIFDRQSGECVGSSSYMNMDRGNQRLEIGYTWLSPKWQRTYVNTEAKFLLLKHAFEKMECVRVEFKTDSRNTRSRAALKRIGAIEEGCLKKHMLVHGERYRDSIYFSIQPSGKCFLTSTRLKLWLPR
jgi:N-acetyltransferase